MSKQILLKTSDEYIVFEDRENPDQLYCITKATWEENAKLVNDNRPNERLIKVLTMGKTGERDVYTDEYDIINYDFIDFPVDRLKPIWAQVIIS